MSETRQWMDRFTRVERTKLLSWVWNTQDEGALLLDGNRRVLDANRAACELLDATREALVGSILPDPPLPGDEVRVRTHRRMADDAGAVFLVTIDDVAAEVGARRAVERIAAAMDELLFTAKVEPGGWLRLVYAAPGGIERLLGGAPPPGTTIDGAWYGAVHPEDREQAQEALRAGARGGATTAEFRMIGLDRRVRWIRTRTQVRRESDGVYVDGIASDVTALREHERDMTRFQCVVEASDAAIALLDLDWHVRWMNRAGLAMTGLDGEHAAGTAFLELVGDEARDDHLAVERPTVERDGRWSGPSVLLTADRSRPAMPVQATTHRIEHPVTGEQLGLASIRRDISDARRLAREHEAIGNLAAAIAAGVGRDEIYDAGSREAAHLLDAQAGGIAMLGARGARTVGAWRDSGADDRLELALSRLAPLLRAGAPTATVALDGGDHGVGAAVIVDGLPWGAIASFRHGPAFTPADERALSRLAGLVGTAVGVTTSRELLVRQRSRERHR